ncbi:MAG: DUF488 domain-containing protein [Burkholderiaceae bacterium]
MDGHPVRLIPPARAMSLQLKRVYDPAEPGDGYRILVDRLWPRGMSKDQAHIDLWLKDVAPTPALRRWFGHDPSKWQAFRRRYFQELAQNTQTVRLITDRSGRETVTLLYAAKDTQHNHALALQQFIQQAE